MYDTFVVYQECLLMNHDRASMKDEESSVPTWVQRGEILFQTGATTVTVQCSK
jgi:hypothetical protein